MNLSLWHVPEKTDYFCPVPRWEDSLPWTSWNEMHTSKFLLDEKVDPFWVRIKVA